MLATAALLCLTAQSPAPTGAPPLPPADAPRLRADVQRLVACGTRHTFSETDHPTRGIGAARRLLVASLEEISDTFHGGRLEVESPAYDVPAGRRVPEGAVVANVLARLPGSDPKRLVVVSGHYDSRASNGGDARIDAPGANDDASGVAVVLECARLLGGLRPRATVVFLAVAGEEQGLLGARAQAQAWRAAGLEVEAFLTNDIVGGAVGSNGRSEPLRLRVFSEGVPSASDVRVVGSDNDSPSRQLARFVEEHGERALPGFDVDLIFRQDRFLRGGDHKPFNELGWAGVRCTEPNENYDWQHQDVRVEGERVFGDRIEFVDFEFVARVATVNAAALAALALAPRPPAGVRMDTSRLSPDTRLSWSAPEEGSGVARHRVRLRRTSEPTWTRTLDAGEGTEVLLVGESKDDWLFALEALDAAGRASLPVYPRPGR